jgi:hypothetical protein
MNSGLVNLQGNKIQANNVPNSSKTQHQYFKTARKTWHPHFKTARSVFFSYALLGALTFLPLIVPSQKKQEQPQLPDTAFVNAILRKYPNLSYYNMVAMPDTIKEFLHIMNKSGDGQRALVDPDQLNVIKNNMLNGKNDVPLNDFGLYYFGYKGSLYIYSVESSEPKK